MGDGPGRAVATLTVAGVLLLLGDWSAPTTGSSWSRSVTIAALPLVLPVAALALRPAWTTYLALAGGLLAGPLRSLYYDPLRDADCRGCFDGAFAVAPDIAVADRLSLAGSVLVTVALLVRAADLRPDSLALALLGVGPVAGVSLLTVARTGLVVAVLSVAGRFLASWWSRRRLTRLVDRLRHAPDADVLARAEADAAARTRVTPEVRLGLEQARLRLDLERRAEDLAESRRRIVERADDEARRLERDLHDGAQQYLLDVGLAVSAARAARASETLDRALTETQACMEELRSVARGVYPPALESAGLRSALTALAGGRFSLLELPEGRLPAPVERTAYLLAATVQARATDPIGLVARVSEGRVELTFHAPPPEDGDVIHDRVAALGGTMTSDGERTVVILPCG